MSLADVATTEHLIVLVHGGKFAMPIAQVREIMEKGVVTPVPMMPPFVLGVINLRGAVVPVIDMAVRFGYETGAPTRKTCIVITEVMMSEERRAVGVLVDAVSAVVEIAAQQIEKTPAFGNHVSPKFIAGVARLDGHVVVVLDMASVLSEEDIASMAGADRIGTAPLA